MLTVITGPPCAGKTTYLHEHATPGDITIDFDQLAQALGSPVTHGHDPSHHFVTIAARNAAIAEAITWHRRGTPVWIIDASPPAARLRQYTAADAGFVRLTAPTSELYRRATAADRPREWRDRIDQWITANEHEESSQVRGTK